MDIEKLMNEPDQFFSGVTARITEQAIEFENRCIGEALSMWQIRKEDVLKRIHEADKLQAENEKLRAEREQVKRERHGRWFFKYPNGWACSRCGEWGLMIDNRGIYKSSYCPKCGARMDKEDEHEAG